MQLWKIVPGKPAGPLAADDRRYLRVELRKEEQGRPGGGGRAAMEFFDEDFKDLK